MNFPTINKLFKQAHDRFIKAQRTVPPLTKAEQDRILQIMENARQVFVETGFKAEEVAETFRRFGKMLAKIPPFADEMKAELKRRQKWRIRNWKI